MRDELLEFVCVNSNIKQLLNNTGSVNCRVQLYSNYDCINSNWFVESAGGYTYHESYFGDMVNALNLNPSIVKKVFEDQNIKRSDVCLSHDYCDSNQAMLDAFQDVFKREPNLMDEVDTALMSQAWTMTKTNNFYV